MGGSQSGRGGGVHGLSQQPGLSTNRLPARLPQDGRLPLHSQYVPQSIFCKFRFELPCDFSHKRAVLCLSERVTICEGGVVVSDSDDEDESRRPFETSVHPRASLNCE